MRFWKVLLILFLATFFVACDGTEEGSYEKPKYKDGDKIELKSVAGTKITLLRKNGGFVKEGDENKILILDFYGTFCAPCQKEAPKLTNFQLKNSDDVILIGLNYLESVSDEYVMENFVSKYNAYYFIVNSPDNDKIINTIVEDINYRQAVQVPYKVVLKNGKYQNVTDIYEGRKDNKYYIGEIDTDIIQKDIDRIKKM